MPVEGALGLEALAADPTAVRFLSSVDQNVSLQVHVLHEALPAHLAQEASLLVVEADMTVQRLFLGEAPPTEAAAEGFLAGVDFQMHLQVAALVEGLPAVSAAERFLSGVDPQVHLQRCVSREGLSAHVAGVAELVVGTQVSSQTGGGLILVSTESAAGVWVLQVSLYVFHQQGSLGEGLLTHFTAMQLHRASLGFVISLMGQQVLLQVPLLPEPLAADVLFFAVVLLHVLFQRRHVTEATAALFTYEGPIGGMDADMGFQVALPAKRLSAYVAAVRFLPSVQSHVQLLR